ncbi:flagellar hook-length control protein FliK [Lysobacter sp. LF1]|uniref:Flagellar hook-length control protein FliK n=1 Tax=Lysobacter stagni TaxID=3045172 RepID=A0ABT6XB91_9GAMM|nr:flagellar hook-length control protein FliK [Lysobacter sp. LF1]MDI9237414.1 flagellar hook-length control protein FliK [Lysobacter sp. LF1]
MHSFNALLPGLGASTGANGAASAQNGANARDTGEHRDGFDRMLQSHARGSADTASRTPATPARTQDADTSGSTSSRKTRNDGQARTSSRDSDTKARESDERTCKADDGASDSTARADAQPTGDSAAADDAPAAQDTATTTDATPATLPEQLLALLNGLAVMPTAPAETTQAVAPTLPESFVAPQGAASTRTPTPSMPAMALPVVPAQTGAPAPAEAAPEAFALAMGAMAAGSADAVAEPTTDTGSPADITPVALTATHAPSAAGNLTAKAVVPVAPQTPLALDADFEDGVGSRIAWMADQKVGHAEIRVSPDHLGTIDVRLQIDGTRVNAEFHSAQADVRHALESSLPRLRDMLGQQGLQLGHTDVGQRQAGQQPGSSNGQSAAANASDRSDPATGAGWTPGPAVRASRGLLDEYA